MLFFWNFPESLAEEAGALSTPSALFSSARRSGAARQPFKGPDTFGLERLRPSCRGSPGQRRDGHHWPSRRAGDLCGRDGSLPPPPFSPSLAGESGARALLEVWTFKALSAEPPSAERLSKP